MTWRFVFTFASLVLFHFCQGVPPGFKAEDMALFTNHLVNIDDFLPAPEPSPEAQPSPSPSPPPSPPPLNPEKPSTQGAEPDSGHLESIALSVVILALTCWHWFYSSNTNRDHARASDTVEQTWLAVNMEYSGLMISESVTLENVDRFKAFCLQLRTLADAPANQNRQADMLLLQGGVIQFIDEQLEMQIAAEAIAASPDRDKLDLLISKLHNEETRRKWLNVPDVLGNKALLQQKLEKGREKQCSVLLKNAWEFAKQRNLISELPEAFYDELKQIEVAEAKRHTIDKVLPPMLALDMTSPSPVSGSPLPLMEGANESPVAEAAGSPGADSGDMLDGEYEVLSSESAQNQLDVRREPEPRRGQGRQIAANPLLDDALKVKDMLIGIAEGVSDDAVTTNVTNIFIQQKRQAHELRMQQIVISEKRQQWEDDQATAYRLLEIKIAHDHQQLAKEHDERRTAEELLQRERLLDRDIKRANFEEKQKLLIEKAKIKVKELKEARKAKCQTEAREMEAHDMQIIQRQIMLSLISAALILGKFAWDGSTVCALPTYVVMFAPTPVKDLFCFILGSGKMVLKIAIIFAFFILHIACAYLGSPYIAIIMAGLIFLYNLYSSYGPHLLYLLAPLCFNAVWWYILQAKTKAALVRVQATIDQEEGEVNSQQAMFLEWWRPGFRYALVGGVVPALTIGATLALSWAILPSVIQ